MDAEGLNAIALELRRIADAKAPQQLLGFGQAPKSQMYVFCNRKHGGVWYNLNEQSQPVNIEHPALTVATHNHKRMGPQSSRFWDQIKCNYPVV